MLMLALGKRLLIADRAVRTGDYDATKVRSLEGTALRWAGITGAHGLYGATLGLVGLGEVGTIVAGLATAFGMRVLYTNRTRYDAEVEQAVGVEYRPLAELLRQADVVSLHASNAPENVGLMGADEFALMKTTALFVNTSRGRLVDEDALYAALRNGTIAGAGLDVHLVEPRDPHDRFCALANVILTPHMAVGSNPGLVAEMGVMFENCRAVLTGRTPAHGLVS
jgi:phosphoglycerate dehydrogenase-like enzyme